MVDQGDESSETKIGCALRIWATVARFMIRIPIVSLPVRVVVGES